MLEGVGRSGGAGVEVEFDENVAEVAGDGFLADSEFLSNGAVAGTGGYQAEHFDFTGAERRVTLWLARRKRGQACQVGPGAEAFEGVSRGGQFERGSIAIVKIEAGACGQCASTGGGIRSVEFAPDGRASAKSGKGAARIAGGEKYGAFGAGGHGLEHRDFEFCGKFAERLSVTARGIEVLFRYRNFDTGFEEFGLASGGAGSGRTRPIGVATDGFGCGVQTALRETKQGESGLCGMAKFSGLGKGLFRLGELAKEAMKLPRTVECGAQGGFGRGMREAVARAERFLQRFAPGAAELENFGTM